MTNENEKPLYNFGNLILHQQDLEETFETPIGRFTLKYLTPLEDSYVEGETSRRLQNAPYDSVPVDVIVSTRICVILDLANAGKDKPAGFQSFRGFHVKKVTADLYGKYSKWKEELDAKMLSMLDSK